MTTTVDQFADFTISFIAGGAGGAGTTFGSSDASFVLPSGVGNGRPYPSTTNGAFYVTIGDDSTTSGSETIKVGTRTGDVCSNLTRAVSGTQQAWVVGSAVRVTWSTVNAQNLWNRVTATPTNVKDYGADNTGATDAAAAIRSAITAAGPNGHVVVPQGTYLLKSGIDFSSIFSGANVYKFRFECAGGVEFVQDASFTSGSVFNLSGPSGFQMIACQIRLGHITGVNNAGNPVIAVNLRYFNDSILEVERINTFLGNPAVNVDMTGTPAFGCFNNRMRFGVLNTCKQAFVTNGNSGNNNFQGNTVHIDHAIASTTNQIVIDQNGTGNTGKNNAFFIGACELGSGAGIIDNNGQNLWVVNNTNSNTNGGFLNASTTHSPLVIGQFDEVTAVGITGGGLWPRWLSIQDVNAKGRGWSVTTPGVPAGTGSGNAVTNANPFSVRIIQKSGTGMHIVQPGGTLGGAGDVALVADTVAFVLDPGAKVYFATAAPVSWNWYGQIL